MKNTGKPAQDAFDKHFAALGKRAAVIEFEDAAALHGLNKKMVRSRAKPSDRILVLDGETSFCEIKSSHSKTSFPFGQFETGQVNYATKVTAAKGKYDVYIWSYETRSWYRLPWVKVATLRSEGRSSIKWAELEEYKITMVEPAK